MKKLLFVFVFLLGSSAYAQNWDMFPGAKKIDDNMKESAENGTSLEDAVKNNRETIYSFENIFEVAAVASLELPLPVSNDYLSKLSNIIKILIKESSIADP